MKYIDFIKENDERFLKECTNEGCLCPGDFFQGAPKSLCRSYCLAKCDECWDREIPLGIDLVDEFRGVHLKSYAVDEAAEYSGDADIKTGMTRSEILDTAKRTVCGHREQDYGSPEDNFAVIARMWEAYLNVEIKAENVAMMMCLFKIGRIMTGTATKDSFVDLAGYAACGAEIAFGGDIDTQTMAEF